jgi:hypothetical protein
LTDSQRIPPVKTARVLHQVRGWIDRVVTRATELVDPPLAADARPLEVQAAIVDAIERRAEPIGGGRRALPHNHVIVTVLAADDEARATLDVALADLPSLAVTRLREIRCDVPAGLAFSLRHVEAPLPGWPPGQKFALEFTDYDAVDAEGPAAAPTLHVTVLRGRTAGTAYTLAEPHVCIGRGEAPVDDDGRVRHNHIAFLEDPADTHAGSVGRAHASIKYDSARGTWQLFDDGSRNGTRVVRKGTAFEVVRRDPIGITIRSGDEIQLGTAAIRVEIR